MNTVNDEMEEELNYYHAMYLQFMALLNWVDTKDLLDEYIILLRSHAGDKTADAVKRAHEVHMETIKELIREDPTIVRRMQ